MAWNVHIHVVIPADNNTAISQIALKHLAVPSDCQEVGWFLEELVRRTGTNPGPKGGLSLWGMIANHASVERFVHHLRAFWFELLTSKDDGLPSCWEHILVFYEEEQSEAAGAYEIFLEPPHAPNPELVIKHHERLPFSFGTF